MRWWVVGVVVSESSDSASAIDEVSALFIAAKRDAGERNERRFCISQFPGL